MAVGAAEGPSPAKRGMPCLVAHLQPQAQEGAMDPDSAATDMHGAQVLCIKKSHNTCFSTSSLDYCSSLLLSCEHDVQPGSLTCNARNGAVGMPRNAIEGFRK